MRIHDTTNNSSNDKYKLDEYYLFNAKNLLSKINTDIKNINNSAKIKEYLMDKETEVAHKWADMRARVKNLD